MKACESCGQIVSVAAPDYPVTCPQCGITYGLGGEVANHRPGSPSCTKRQLEKKAEAKP